ncbi:MAG TPA: hypothetical protein VGP18_08410 [Solirubrobacteraceae bacterium]|jgi:hypothetical protein|nr:hypothetical protein [Solirubrobacteraceae bacterium]
MRGPIATILTVLAFGVIPATAFGAPQDVASTHAYIRANYALNRATQAKVKAAQANIETVIGKLGQECPKLAVGSPQNQEAQHLSYEVVVALWSASYATDAGPIRRFANTVRHLRWSNPKLTDMARRYATDLQELSSLQMPNVCGDVTTWKESGFKTAPATSIQLDRRVEAIEPKAIPESLLSPYEKPADKAILATTTRIETQLQQTETVEGFNDWDQALETVGLNQ